MRSGLLRSTIRTTVWKPCERLTASCLFGTAGSLRCKHAPNEDCSCGIYAWQSRDDLDRLVSITYDMVPVWGSVSLWGEIHPHERGLRAEYAYPYELFISEEYAAYAKILRRNYAVDVVTVPWPPDMARDA